MPPKRRSPKRRENLPEALGRLLAGEPVEHTTETRRLLRDVRYFGLYGDVLTAADLQRVGKAHSVMLGEWLASGAP